MSYETFNDVHILFVFFRTKHKSHKGIRKRAPQAQIRNSVTRSGSFPLCIPCTIKTPRNRKWHKNWLKTNLLTLSFAKKSHRKLEGRKEYLKFIFRYKRTHLRDWKDDRNLRRSSCYYYFCNSERRIQFSNLFLLGKAWLRPTRDWKNANQSDKM